MDKRLVQSVLQRDFQIKLRKLYSRRNGIQKRKYACQSKNLSPDEYIDENGIRCTKGITNRRFICKRAAMQISTPRNNMDHSS